MKKTNGEEEDRVRERGSFSWSQRKLEDGGTEIDRPIIHFPFRRVLLSHLLDGSVFFLIDTLIDFIARLHDYRNCIFFN